MKFVWDVDRGTQTEQLITVITPLAVDAVMNSCDELLNM